MNKKSNNFFSLIKAESKYFEVDDHKVIQELKIKNIDQIHQSLLEFETKNISTSPLKMINDD